MTITRDLSGNGGGVNLNNRGEGNLIDLTTTDAIVANGGKIRVGGAGNLILRLPNSSADITIAAAAGEYVPVVPGTTVRKTGTTATVLHSMPDLRMRG